jgi:hypothetical protein
MQNPKEGVMDNQNLGGMRGFIEIHIGKKVTTYAGLKLNY